MHASELRHRVVAVLRKHARVQLFCPLDPDLALRDGRWRHVAAKFIEKQPPQRFRRSRVARKQRALHRFWQICEREDRSRQVGKVRRKGLLLVRSEFGHGVRLH
jgi:hypothetical protein